MRDRLTLHELAQRSGERVERLAEWRALGLIDPTGDGELGWDDVQRTRLIQLLLRRGITLDAIARADREQGFLAHSVETMSPSGVRPARPLHEATEMLGHDPEAFRRFWSASGLGEQGEPLDDYDLQLLRAVRVALEAGFPEDALVQLARVYADALGRVADAEVRLFHFYVHERLKAQGLSGQELVAASDAARVRTAPLVEPLILYFHQRGLERAVREDAVMHLQEEAGLLPKPDVPGQLQVAIVFVDLSSFTPLVEAMGDEAAAQVLERFSRLVREAANRCDGRVGKQIGDAFMLLFPAPRAAVACALEIEWRAAAEPQFPAVRSGVHWGQVLYREGDYVGATVNVAARLAHEAGRHQVLVTAAVRTEAGTLADVEFVPLGRRRLRGLTEELELFEVVATTGQKPRRLVDPVCGMEIDAAEVAARLSVGGEERAFCSQECLRRFVQAPERYGAGR